MSLHILLLQFRKVFRIFRRFRALDPFLRIDVGVLQRLRHFVTRQRFQKRVRVKEFCLDQVELGSKSLRVFQKRTVVVEQLNGAFLQIECLLHLEPNLFQFPFEVFRCVAHVLLF